MRSSSPASGISANSLPSSRGRARGSPGTRGRGSTKFGALPRVRAIPLLATTSMTLRFSSTVYQRLQWDAHLIWRVWRCCEGPRVPCMGMAPWAARYALSPTSPTWRRWRVNSRRGIHRLMVATRAITSTARSAFPLSRMSWVYVWSRVMKR